MSDVGVDKNTLWYNFGGTSASLLNSHSTQCSTFTTDPIIDVMHMEPHKNSASPPPPSLVQIQVGGVAIGNRGKILPGKLERILMMVHGVQD
jgi:hypothetical protein